MSMKEFKKALIRGKIRLSSHTFDRMEKRGYTKGDIVSCIMSGELTAERVIKGRIAFEVQGYDKDKLPVVVHIGYDQMPGVFKIISVLPPIDKKFKRVI